MLRTSHEYVNYDLQLHFKPVAISHWYSHMAVFGWARYRYEDSWFAHTVEHDFDNWIELNSNGWVE
jgi:hypothetical protein